MFVEGGTCAVAHCHNGQSNSAMGHRVTTGIMNKNVQVIATRVTLTSQVIPDMTVGVIDRYSQTHSAARSSTDEAVERSMYLP